MEPGLLMLCSYSTPYHSRRFDVLIHHGELFSCQSYTVLDEELTADIYRGGGRCGDTVPRVGHHCKELSQTRWQ